MRLLSAALAIAHCLLADLASAQSGCPEPKGRLIGAPSGGRLHLIEWGGSGAPLVFLSGAGSSAYAFDEFAPLFTDRYRVIGITRAGMPPSDPSPRGYRAEVLAADIVAILDSLQLPAAHIVGWSFGGDEAVLVAAGSPSRVVSVVLLDSYDNSPEAGTFRAVDSLQVSVPNPFLPSDSTSAAAMQWRAQRSGLRALPLGATCAANVFAPDGRFLRPKLSPRERDAVTSALLAGLPLLPYRSLHQPVLAFFAVARGVGDRYPTYATLAPADRERIDRLFPLEEDAFGAARARLRREVPHASIVEIPGAAHAVFRSHPELVYLRMREFLENVERSRH